MTSVIHVFMMSAKIFTRKATILLVIFFFCYYCKAEVQHKKPIKNSTNIEHLTSTVTPLNYEYLQTPNFNCLLLPEEAKNTEWKKYAALFDPPKSLSNTTPIVKTYKAGQRRKRLQHSNSTKTLNDPPRKTSTEVSDHNLPPVVSFSLERRIVETMFELLEKKNHIIVLQPRHCNAEQSESSNAAALMLQKNDRADFRNFAESLLQKLMQQLKNPNSDLIHPSEVPKPKVDPIVKRILEQLEREEEVLIKKIYNNLMDEKPTRPQSENYLRTKKSKNAEKHFDASSRNTIDTKIAKNAKSSEIKEVPRSTRDCDKGYVFLVGSHNDGGKDLLMRAVRIVNKKER